ncbi:MAG TPA: hypothetical protein EYG74_07330 [Sulfurimonas autotrophica]|nr:hypothetical protein [Sulfurimonas autotrophica]
MQNYSIKNRIPGYFICFLVQGDGTEWIDADLPTPNWFRKFKHSYLIGWLIDGYFATSRNQAYLNDIVARMIFTLPVIEKLNYRPNNELQTHKIYKLKEFQALKSLPSKFKGYEYTIKSRGGHDRVFWAIKWKVEQIIEEQGEGRIVPYELIESWAKMHFEDDVKDKSTLRAKCRSVWNWYDNRGWTIPTRREFLMSRSEAGKRAIMAKAERTKQKIIDAMNGAAAGDLKKKNGKWNAKKIAEVAGVTEKTVRKYLKELEL